LSSSIPQTSAVGFLVGSPRCAIIHYPNTSIYYSCPGNLGKISLCHNCQYLKILWVSLCL
jgi:hypothetical protein